MTPEDKPGTESTPQSKCELCGSPIKVVGSTTLHYEPYVADIQSYAESEQPKSGNEPEACSQEELEEMAHKASVALWEKKPAPAAVEAPREIEVRTSIRSMLPENMWLDIKFKEGEEAIHFIEYSAFEAMRKERDEFENKYMRDVKSLQKYQHNYETVQTELTQAKAERDQLNKLNEMVVMERDQVIADLKQCRADLAELKVHLNKCYDTRVEMRQKMRDEADQATAEVTRLREALEEVTRKCLSGSLSAAIETSSQALKKKETGGGCG